MKIKQKKTTDQGQGVRVFSDSIKKYINIKKGSNRAKITLHAKMSSFKSDAVQNSLQEKVTLRTFLTHTRFL